MSNYLADIINSANEGIYVTDRDRRISVWNAAAEKISGYRKGEIVGHRCRDNILCHTDRLGNMLCLSRCPLQAAIEDGTARGPDIVYLKHKDGRRIAVEVKTAPVRDESGSVIGGVEVFQDVTERLEQERLLRERKEKLESVLDSIEDGILFIDTGGSISAMNRACGRFMHDGEEARGKPVHALPLHATIRQALLSVEHMAGNALNPSPAAAPECGKSQGLFRCWTAGIDRSQFAPTSPCFDCIAYHRIRTFLEKPHDVSWEDRTMSVTSSFIEMRETNELWETIVFHDATAEKLDAALKVAGAAAHELRQPLQAILILAGLIEQKAGHEASLDHNIEMLAGSCDRMDDIIKKMLEITEYKTKPYVGGLDILDIERSATRK